MIMKEIMKEFAAFFIYIGCLLTVLIGSFLFGGIFYIATGIDLFVCDWIVVSVILALFFAAEMWREIF